MPLAFISFEKKIWQGRGRCKIRLNARNVVGNGDLIPIGVQPWGEYSTVRLTPERRWYLTNTFSL